ncbi:MAG: hypothetical protein ACREJU_03750 [Nitrospiraceae bacterium]
MKIRRKLPKPPRLRHPSHIIGYSSNAPDPSDLQRWFDLEYGGPLVFKGVERNAAELQTYGALVSHGPWNAWLRLSLSSSEAEEWKQRLAWRHDGASAIVGAPLTPRLAIDTILHAARMARGLTLLTEGTAYDVITQVYLNPADWKDRPLDQFHVRDHIEVLQTEAAEAGLEWFYTRGLNKFGFDDIETFRPVGLPSRDIMDTLRDIADEILRLGQSPTVGLTLPLPTLGLSLRVIRHRTAFPLDSPLALREITWSPLT